MGWHEQPEWLQIRSYWKRFWGLSWWWKGSAAGGALAVPVALIVVVVLATGGSNNTAVSGMIGGPTPTATAPLASPTRVPTPTPHPSPTDMTTSTPSSAPTPTQGGTTSTLEEQQPPSAGNPPPPAETPTSPPPAPTPTSPPPPPAPTPTSPPPPPAPTPTPTPIDLEQVCSDGATTVSGRIETHYRAAGYPSTTYDGMRDEAFAVYFSLCMATSDGDVDLFDFCYGVAENAWRYFFYQEDAAVFLSDCLSGAYY